MREKKLIESLTKRAGGVLFPPKPDYSTRAKMSDFRRDLLEVLRENDLLVGITQDSFDWDEESQTFCWTWEIRDSWVPGCVGSPGSAIWVSARRAVSINPREPLLPQIEALQADWEALQQNYRLASRAVGAAMANNPGT